MATNRSKTISPTQLAFVGFLLGVLLCPLIFTAPHSAKVTKVVSNFHLTNRTNIAPTSGQYVFENAASLDPVIAMGVEQHTSSVNFPGVEIINLDNLQYILSANIYSKIAEFKNAYESKEADTEYSLDKFFGSSAQQTFLTSFVHKIDVEGRIKAISMGSLSKDGDKTLMAILTDAFEIALVDTETRQLLWKVDFRYYLETSNIAGIEEYTVSLQKLPKHKSKYNTKEDKQEINNETGEVERKSVVLAVWKIRLVPDMIGNRFVLLLVALDGKKGTVKWASVAETLDKDDNNVIRKANPAPVYFNLAAGKKEGASVTTETKEATDDNSVDIIGILSHMAASRLPMYSSTNIATGLSSSSIIGVKAGKYTTKEINKRSNVTKPSKANKSTFREIVETSTGNNELTSEADTLLFLSPSHILAIDFDSGNYLFGAILQKGTLLFSVGGVPYALYTVASCTDSNKSTLASNKIVSVNRPCAVLAEVKPTEKVVSKIHWAVTLEDSIVSRKLSTKGSKKGNSETPENLFTGNLVDTPIKPIIFQENMFSPPKLVVLSPTGYLHCFDLKGNTLWVHSTTCGENVGMSGTNTSQDADDFVSLSAQHISGKSVVVTVCGGVVEMLWAETGEVASAIVVNGDNEKDKIHSITFSQLVPEPAAPTAVLVKSRASSTGKANLFVDIYALSGFDGTASKSFSYSLCIVIVAGILGALLFTSFPLPETKTD